MRAGGSIIWLITKKEIITNIRNFKIPVTFVAMTLLLLVSAQLVAIDYQSRLNNWSINHDSQHDPVIGGRVSYDLADGSFSHLARFSHSPPLQPPQAFSSLVKGMDGEMDRWVTVSDQIIFWARQDQPAIKAFFDTPDTSFIIKLFVSIFALVFSLDAATREKETGTLKAMLAQPIRRRELILSKSLGASISLLTPLAVAYLIEILYLHMAHGLLNDRQDLARAMMIFGLASLYGLVFLHIGLFISTVTIRTRIAITTALLSWVTIVLILPGASVLMAKLITPASSYNQLNARLREARMGILQGEVESDPAAKAARPSLQSALRIYEIERHEVDKYLAGKRDQNRRARLFAALSPTGALAFGSSDLAGTGVDTHNSYLELFRSKQDIMIDALKRSIYLSRQEGDEILKDAREKVANMQRRAEPPGASFRSSIIPISSLLVWAIFFGIASCWRFERSDVR